MASEQGDDAPGADREALNQQQQGAALGAAAALTNPAPEETAAAAAAAEPKEKETTAEDAPPSVSSGSTALPLRVHDRCQVRWRSGEQNLLATVVARRPHRDRGGGKASSKSKRNKRGHGEMLDGGDGDDGLDSLPPDAIDYYVHYVHHDRRLDEWITHDKFLLDTLERKRQHKTEAGGGGGAAAAAATTTASGGSVEDDGGDDTMDEDGDAAATETDSNIDNSSSRLLTRRRSSASINNNNPSERSSTQGDSGSEQPLSQPQLQPSASFSLSGGNWHGGGGGGAAASALEREHEETTKIKNISKIVMGGWEVEAWYYSPFPAEYCDIDCLYVCEFCLQYMKKRATLRRHRSLCPHRRPPGREIYRENGLSVFELDGRDHRAYCQKLCLLAKLFLDHKTLYYDVNPFFFYVVTTVDSDGAHIVGYFSKEKVSTEGYNLACILTFPQYQKSGYGKFIISLSYELTKREGITGSPEKPLSDLGKVSYRSYWTHVLMNLLAQHDSKSNLSISDISTETGIKTEDLISTLQSLDMIKVWKGQHVIYVQQETIANYMKQEKKLRLCKSEFLTWEPPTGSGAAKENA